MTYIVSILNITPDSFSGDGVIEKSIEKAKQTIEEGADIIDVGAESTRPGATPLSAEEEWQRLEMFLPKIIEMAHKNHIKISIDTRHYQNAQRAIEAGVDIINDVDGFTSQEMIDVASKSKVPLVVTHSLTVPADRNINIPDNVDVVDELTKWAENRKQKLLNAGIEQKRIIFDPGIGFGKTAKQSFEIIRNVDSFSSLGLDIFIGHSRKSFLSEITDLPSSQRDIESLAISLYLYSRGVKYIRVHNTEIHRRALKTLEKLKEEHAEKVDT